MSRSVAAERAVYFLQHLAVDVELQWGGPEPEWEKQTFPLLLTTTYGNATRADFFNVEVCNPALATAGVIPMRAKGERWKPSRKDGFHVLRHTYASTILEARESVVTLARWLGHSSRTINLDHCAHLMLEAGDKGRAAVDERRTIGSDGSSPVPGRRGHRSHTVRPWDEDVVSHGEVGTTVGAYASVHASVLEYDS
ncbi:hypothetical protein R1T08_00585 [Streptomyces sp. SBC-4]|nr:hypothetical protein [Streptomyces sp. SBC-4]MDV5142861.1 hypothetical protein [Streptomyces sp. SBC-4]